MKNFVMNLNIIFLWAVLTGITPAVAVEPVYQFSRDVVTDNVSEEELLAIQLDTDIFAATQLGHPDLRLLNQKGETVPYLLRKVQTTRARKKRTTWSSQKITAKPREQGGLEITVILAKDDPHPNSLNIVTALKDFEQRVQVYTSADATNWEQAGVETLIYDYSQYIDVRSNKISFPETERRYFRIVIENVTLEQESELLTLTRQLSNKSEQGVQTERVTIDRRPFRIDLIEFCREVEQEQTTGDEKTEYPILDFQVEKNPKEPRTVLLINTQRQPLNSFKLITEEKNFSRQATLLEKKTQGTQITWTQIASSTLSRIDFKDLKREDLSISFPESRQKTFQIVIDNRDNAPLQFTGVQARGNVYQLVFLADPQSQYQLLYAATDAEAATYDTAAIQELLQNGFQSTLVELKAQQAVNNPDKPSSFQWKKLLNNPVLLTAVIILLVILLGWGLYQASKRMDSLPND